MLKASKISIHNNNTKKRFIDYHFLDGDGSSYLSFL